MYIEACEKLIYTLVVLLVGSKMMSSTRKFNRVFFRFLYRELPLTSLTYQQFQKHWNSFIVSVLSIQEEKLYT